MDFHLPGTIPHSFLPVNFSSGKILPVLFIWLLYCGEGEGTHDFKGKETSSLLSYVPTENCVQAILMLKAELRAEKEVATGKVPLA